MTPSEFIRVDDVLALIPGGSYCDPQQIADDVRELALRSLAAQQGEPADQQLRQAAEQFVAAYKDGNAAELLDYFEDIFREALSTSPQEQPNKE